MNSNRTTPASITDASLPHGAAMLRLLERADILQDLPPRHLELFLRIGSAVEIPADSILAVQGGRSEQLHIILEGSVQLSTPTTRGYLELRTAGPGETIPLSALVGDGTLTTTALAVGSAVVFQLPVADVLRICEDYPDAGRLVYRQIAAIFAGRYRKTVQQLAMDGAGVAAAALESLMTS